MEPKPLDHYTTEFQTLGKVPAGTDVHKSKKHDRFIVTGGSSVPGGQTIANLFKGHTSQTVASDIHALATHLKDDIRQNVTLMKTTEDLALKRKIYGQLLETQRAFSSAEGDPKQGLKGMATTYKDQAPYLLNSIGMMHEAVIGAVLEAEAEMQRAGLEKGPGLYASSTEQLPYCPEEYYSDTDWHRAVDNSHDLRKECVSLGKYIKYAGSLRYNRMMSGIDAAKTSVKGAIMGEDAQPGWSWWNKVYTPPLPPGAPPGTNAPSLFLGAVPLTKEIGGKEFGNHLEQMQAEGIGAVLSMTEVFENSKGGIITSPISPEQMKEAGMIQFQLPTPDFKTIPLELIQRGVEFIDWNLRNGRSVYVHCKAGRARSALVEACYLVKHQGMTAEQAYAIIKEARPQAGFKGPKMDTLKEFERLCRAGEAAPVRIHTPGGVAASEREFKGEGVEEEAHAVVDADLPPLEDLDEGEEPASMNPQGGIPPQNH